MDAVIADRAMYRATITATVINNHLMVDGQQVDDRIPDGGVGAGSVNKYQWFAFAENVVMKGTPRHCETGHVKAPNPQTLRCGIE
ncbi:Uncharacterised protein [Mycobacterium tuberculosis]|nr:Uncharacterised protein [Mycobacterium tuberculosis]